MVHHSFTRLLLVAGFLSATLTLSDSAIAQRRDSVAGIRFPANPASWINSQPFSREQLEGKVAVMVFFEEG